MASTQGAFVWYELMTTDVPAAKAFYGDVVGWNTQDMPMPGMTYTVLQAGETGVAGMMPMPREVCDAGMPPFWVGYIHVADVDAAAAQVTTLGGSIHREPTDIPTVGRFAVAADPQGAVFHLFKPTPTGEREPSTAPGNIGWHELHAKDWPKAFEFYSALFGWQKGNSVDMGPMGTYQLFTINGVDGGAMFNSPGAAAHRFWLYYFVVDDIDAAAGRATTGGGKIMHGPVQVPDGRWIVQATDPQGAWFALLGARR
jgi:uncharacterized protein